MRVTRTGLLVLLPVIVSAFHVTTKDGRVLNDHTLLRAGRPQIALWQALHDEETKSFETLNIQGQSDQVPFALQSDINTRYPAYCFQQPINHFTSGSETFCQRYWLDASHYKPGGPVYVLDGGETSGKNRLEFLERGILEILANATDGLAIVLEHRYYGASLPVQNLTTDSLRFLNNEQAMADSANFIANFTLPKTVTIQSNVSLNPPHTPWIYYGGSYAGARAAHMRVQYPELVWGAIASSAVTHAQVDFPDYWKPIQSYANRHCIAALELAVETIDNILDLPDPIPRGLKSLFGLGDLQHDDDFADVIQSPLGSWQAKHWDESAPGAQAFDVFCSTLLSGQATSYIGAVKIPAIVMNYAKFIKEHVVSSCPGGDVENCFDSYDDEKFRVTDADQTWRLWLFQVCTQWGYFMPAPPEGPRIVSKRLTLEYTSKICKQAFPPGQHFAVPNIPRVDEVNKRGDFRIEADRLAFIDGDRDPWRPAADGQPKRENTLNKPAFIIFDGVHHYDEVSRYKPRPGKDIDEKFGLADHSQEPERIRKIHAQEVEFVQSWLQQWRQERSA